MNKTITIIALTAIGILSLMWWGKSIQKPLLTNGGPTSAASILTTEEKLYNFGTISMANGNVSTLFTVTNPTSEDIVLKTVQTSCMCTKAYIIKDKEKGPFGMPGMGFVPPANETIKTKESIDIRVVYDPAAHGPAGVGPIDRFIYLVDSNGGTLELEIKAVVTP